MLYLFLAQGFEETEALAPYDCIKRAGLGILSVGVDSLTVTGTKGITVLADIGTDEIDLTNCDGVILPGGMPGTENLYQSEAVKNAITFCAENNKLIASICAAPSVPGRMGLLNGKKAVCYPGFEKYLAGHISSDGCVQTDGNFITAKGAGCVFPFACAIISYLKSDDAAKEVMRQIQYADL